MNLQKNHGFMPAPITSPISPTPKFNNRDLVDVPQNPLKNIYPIPEDPDVVHFEPPTTRYNNLQHARSHRILDAIVKKIDIEVPEQVILNSFII